MKRNVANVQLVIEEGLDPDLDAENGSSTSRKRVDPAGTSCSSAPRAISTGSRTSKIASIFDAVGSERFTLIG